MVLDKITPETLDPSINLIRENYSLILITLASFSAGFLIFFYLKRIKNLSFLDGLSSWENFGWFVVLSFINFFVSAFLVSLSLLFSVSIGTALNLPPEFIGLIGENLLFIFIFTLFVIPITIYSREFPTTRKQDIGIIMWVLFMILLLTIANLTFLIRLSLKVFILVIILVIILVGLLNLKDRLIEETPKRKSKSK